MDDALKMAVQQTLSERYANDVAGVRISDVRRLTGGDINDAYAVYLEGLAEGPSAVFVKSNPQANPCMFSAEAHGLRWLSSAGALRLPEVLGHSPAHSDYPGPHYLLLEMLHPAQRVCAFDELLGRGLAALHKVTAERHGLEQDNFIGTLKQDNSVCAVSEHCWSTFYVERRLRPQLRLAVDAGRASPKLRSACENLFSRMPDLVGPGDEEPPAYLHGDLWAGNLHVDDNGEPCLIDPAAYAGHREMDLAMMRLFGGYSPTVFDAYHEMYPLEPGESSRSVLYQIYPLFVHLNLFGGHYGEAVMRAVQKYL